MSNIQGLLDKYLNDGAERFFHDVFEKQEYAPARNQKADVVLDIGALAGEFSAYIYDQAEKIYAIEPYGEHYKELISNIKEFGLKKIKPFRLALSNYNGKGYMIGGSRGGNVLINESGSDKTEKVKVKTLATFMKDNNIKHVNILKIDVEAAENLIFRSDDFKKVAKKIDFIIGEHLGGLQSLFKNFGFKVNEYSESPNNIYFKRE